MTTLVCVVFTWRCNRTSSIWQSERYGPTIRSCKSSFYYDVRNKGTILCAKTHTGTNYSNGGRFV